MQFIKAKLTLHHLNLFWTFDSQLGSTPVSGIWLCSANTTLQSIQAYNASNNLRYDQSCNMTSRIIAEAAI